MERAKQIPCGEVLTSVPMAKLLGVNWTTLRDWCRDFEGFAESGVFQAGDKGVNYTFEPRATVLWLIRHFEAKRLVAANRSQRIAEMTGTTEMVDTAGEMSLAEMDKALSITTRLRVERTEQQRLTDAQKALAGFREYHSTIQQAAMRSAQEQDPEGRWPPEIRESFEDAMQSLLLSLEQAGRQCAEALGQT
jgi:cell fate (sporulation/competence/biofilm development) regulator YlbF (YheA/YmcA/DUF963 family)